MPPNLEPIPAATEVAPLHVRIVGRAAALIEVLKSAAVVVAFLSPVFWWAYSTLEAQAGEFVIEQVAPLLAEQNAKLDMVTESNEQLQRTIESLVRGQTNEATQSRGEADVNQEILCLLKELKGETPGSDCP